MKRVMDALRKRNDRFFLCIIFLISFLIFLPSLTNFYSHDDFFNLKISNARSLSDFLNFFNLINAPFDFGFYRPLTTQVFFLMGRVLFNLNPIYLHIIAFVTFYGVIWLVYKLVKELSNNRVFSILAALLYATSATHFGHLYYLSAFQEVGLAFFYFLTVYLFLRFLKLNKQEYLICALAAFVGALLSKESAVTLPLTLFVIYLFCKRLGNVGGTQKLLFVLLPFGVILAVYLYLHIFHYGLAKGDSYIWDFSPRIFNTFSWYLVWSLNLPEMFVDFVSFDLSYNPNLFRYYSNYAVPIIGLFLIEALFLISLFVSKLRKLTRKDFFIFFLSVSWFFTTLLPVLFLPWHKFTYELTVPLFGVVLFLSYLLYQLNKKYQVYFTSAFIIAWVGLSLITLSLTSRTHWVTQGGIVSRNVYQYLNTNSMEGVEAINFYDTKEDLNLPWLPSKQLKETLSDNNFFEVYNFDLKAVFGESVQQDEKVLNLRARQFLNY